MKIKTEGKTEFDRFNNVVKKMLSVSKEELQRRLDADPRGHPKPTRKKRKPAKASASRASGGDSRRA